MTITDHDVRVAEHIIDTSGLAERLAPEMRHSPRGRPQNLPTIRLWLIGLFLAIHHGRTGTLTTAYRMLTREAPVGTQLRLGVAAVDPTAPSGHRIAISPHQIAYASRQFFNRLAYGNSADIDADEKHRRRLVLQGAMNALMDLFQDGFTSPDAALDASGIWSWTRGKAAPRKPVDPDSAGDLAAAGSGDSDAAWGYKTSKLGASEIYFGYAEHALVRVPSRKQKPDDEPRLVTRFTCIPANAEITTPCLELLDSLPAPLDHLIVDRHYSYKRVETWADQLLARQIKQVFDLRADDQGFIEYDRMRYAAGWPHCPATPDHLGEIVRPSALTSSST